MTSPSKRPHKITWKQRISKARKLGSFTEKDNDDASNWTKCSVGERFHPTMQMIDNCNMDQLFQTRTIKLGLAFTEAVQTDDFKRADMLYRTIKKLPESEKKF